MKSGVLRVLSVLATGVVLSATVTACAKSGDDEQIRQLEAHFLEAFRALDVGRIMECYAADGSLFAFDVGPPREFVGFEAYKRNWENLLGPYPGPVTVDVSDATVTIDGKLAFGHSIIRFVGTDRGGRTTDLTMRVTKVYRKIAGEWRIVQEHSSVPVDLATGKPDFASRAPAGS